MAVTAYATEARILPPVSGVLFPLGEKTWPVLLSHLGYSPGYFMGGAPLWSSVPPATLPPSSKILPCDIGVHYLAFMNVVPYVK